MVYIEKRKVSRFLKVMTKLKQLVTKQIDKIVATSVSVSVLGGGGGGSIVVADLGLPWLVLLASGLSSEAPSHRL